MFNFAFVNLGGGRQSFWRVEAVSEANVGRREPFVKGSLLREADVADAKLCGQGRN